MRVRQVLGSGARRETCTLVDDDGRVVELVDDYLALCTGREHSPNTLRARAYDLKEWLTFLRLLNIAPLAAVPEHVGQFAGWLRRLAGPGQLRPVNADDGPSRDATTANRILNSVCMFYEFLARRGVGLGAQMERHRPARPGDHAGFLAGIAERSVRERPTRLKEKKRRPETLSDAEVQQIPDACDRLRDRLLMSVMFEKAAGSARPWACATRTSAPAGSPSRCSRGRTTPTVPAGRAGIPGRSRSGRRCSTSTPTTYSVNTAS
jgi:hypothetical protein